jgi:hypothetical protein
MANNTLLGCPPLGSLKAARLLILALQPTFGVLLLLLFPLLSRQCWRRSDLTSSIPSSLWT